MKRLHVSSLRAGLLAALSLFIAIASGAAQTSPGTIDPLDCLRDEGAIWTPTPCEQSFWECIEAGDGRESLCSDCPEGFLPLLPERLIQTHRPPAPRVPRHPLALKTNMLFDLVGAPNVGVEVPLGRHFSLTADIAYAFWRIDNRYALQTLQGGIGAKFWFSQKKGQLTGWNVGLYGMYCARYDVQWQDGYQGDGFWSGGISVGYSWAVSPRLRLEASVAAGVFYTPEVRHYTRPENGHLMWQETRYNVTRFAPTKLQLNLIWLIGKKK